MKRKSRNYTTVNLDRHKLQCDTRRKKYRIRSKTRFTLFMICVLVMMIFTTSTVLGANTSESIIKPNYIQIVVEPGDTLWQLAVEFGPENQDTRKVVNNINNVNELFGNCIQPGQIILIPEFI